MSIHPPASRLNQKCLDGVQFDEAKSLKLLPVEATLWSRGGRDSGSEIEMPNPRIRRPYGFRPPSRTGRSYGTLAPSCGGILARDPQAYRANCTARMTALFSGGNAGVSAPGEPK